MKQVVSGTFNGAYPTTGSKFLLTSVGGGTFTISFSAPQSAFGFYATDVGDGAGRIGLSFDLTPVSVPSSALTPTGSVLFFGYIDPDHAFTAVTFANLSQGIDGFGFDDLTVGRRENVVSPVPEPRTWFMLMAGFVLLGGFVRNGRSAGRLPANQMA